MPLDPDAPDYAQGARRNTAVSVWQIQALKAALLAGANVPGLKRALALAVKDLKSVQDPATGRFGYSRRGEGSWAMTAAAVCKFAVAAATGKPCWG